jgi:hypothetical protein
LFPLRAERVRVRHLFIIKPHPLILLLKEKEVKH